MFPREANSVGDIDRQTDRQIETCFKELVHAIVASGKSKVGRLENPGKS